MNNEPLLTIRKIVGKGPVLRKKVMRLPILSLQSERDRPPTVTKKPSLQVKQRRTQSQMLNIIECVQPITQHLTRTVGKKKQRPKEADNCSQSLICCRKRYSSLSAKVFKGDIEQAMHKIQEKQREHFKTKTLDWRTSINNEGQSQGIVYRKDRKGSQVAVAVGGSRKVAAFNSLRSNHLRGIRKEIIFKGKDHSRLQQTGHCNNNNKHAQTQRSENLLQGWASGHCQRAWQQEQEQVSLQCQYFQG